MRLVLASSSPRRRQLLESLGLDFEVEAPEVDETRHPDEAPTAYAERLARAKAAALAGSDRVVIAADTIVVHRGLVMGKPSHPAEAKSMLERLSGEWHTVVSGVAVASWHSELLIVSDTDRTAVSFVDITAEEVATYVATGEPMDKSGAYALQGAAAAFVDRVEGSPSNVVGLPVLLATRLLRSAGISVLGQVS